MTTGGPPPVPPGQHPYGPPPGGSPPGWIRRRLSNPIVVVALVAGLLLILGAADYVRVQASHFYTIAPGTAPVVSADASCPTTGSNAYFLSDGKPCVRLVLPAAKVHAVDGSIMMVDVLVGPTSPQDYILNKLGLLHHYHDGSVLVPNDEILGSTPASQLQCQDVQQMSDSDQFAAVVALRRLGYSVKENDLGAQIDQVQPGTPAAVAGIQCNDLVTSIDGVAVHTDADLVNEVRKLVPGNAAHVTVQRVGNGGKVSTVSVDAKLVGTPALDGQAAVPARAFLGVETETRTTFTFPIAVNVDVGAIGGPSAGLALTLGLLNALSGGDLTGGLHVAATGTIDLQGNVGDVGGVAQKTVAVRKAGAKYFFVPPQELKAAESEAGSLKIYSVSTLQQALNDLQALGGHIPPAATSQTGSG